jgi:hypothetical protein
VGIVTSETLFLESVASPTKTTSHRTHRHVVLEYITTALIDDLVHQGNQVRALIRLLVLLGKVLDRIVHELLETAL